METENIEPRLFTVEQTAQYLNLSPRTIYNAVAPNTLAPFPVQPVRIGRKVLFRKKDLDTYIDSL